jgi:hypothetical protein
MSEPTRLPVLLRARRGGSKARAIIAMLLLAGGSAFAAIGDRAEVVEAYYHKDRTVRSVSHGTFRDMPTIEVRYLDGATVSHVIGRDRREIATCSSITTAQSAAIKRKLDREWRKTWKPLGQLDPGVYYWKNKDGVLWAVGSGYMMLIASQ